MVVDIQLLIMFYKDELRKNPNDEASKFLLAHNRAKLKEMKDVK